MIYLIALSLGVAFGAFLVGAPRTTPRPAAPAFPRARVAPAATPRAMARSAMARPCRDGARDWVRAGARAQLQQVLIPIESHTPHAAMRLDRPCRMVG